MSVKHLQYKMVREFFLQIGGVKEQQAKATYLNCAEGMSFDVLGHFCTQYAILLFVLNYLFLWKYFQVCLTFFCKGTCVVTYFLVRLCLLKLKKLNFLHILLYFM